MNEKRHVIIQVWKCDSVLRTDWLSDDDFIDIVELVPILVTHALILDQRFELWTTRDCHVESLCCKKAFRIEQIEKVVVNEIRQQLISESIKRRHLRQRQIPLAES